MKFPLKPSPPREPKVPSKTVIKKEDTEITKLCDFPNSFYSQGEIVIDPGKITLQGQEKIIIKTYSYQDDEESDTSTSIEGIFIRSEQEIDNPNYEKEMKKYKLDLDKYHKETINYNKKLHDYEIQNKQYNAWVEDYKIKNLLKQKEIAEKTIKQIEKKILNKKY